MGERTRGLYVPLDVNYRDDPKVIEAGADAELVYLRSLVLAKRLGRDGEVHRAHLRNLSSDLFSVAGSGDVTAEDIAKDLVVCGLWAETPTGWVISAWLKHNPSATELEESRASEASRKAAWRESRKDASSRDEMSHGTGSDATRSEERVKERVKRRASAPPKDLVPDEWAVKFASEHGLDIDGERDGWLDHCEAKGTTYKNHQAGFRTWLRNAVEFGRGGKVPVTLDFEVPRPAEWVCGVGNPHCHDGNVDDPDRPVGAPMPRCECVRS